MGGERRSNPAVGRDGRVPLTVRLEPDLREKLYSRADKDGMTLSSLIVRLLAWGLENTETVLVGKGCPPPGSGRGD